METCQPTLSWTGDIVHTIYYRMKEESKGMKGVCNDIAEYLCVCTEHDIRSQTYYVSILIQLKQPFKTRGKESNEIQSFKSTSMKMIFSVMDR